MPLSVEQAIKKAKRVEKAGDTAEAVALYSSVLEKFPNNARAYAGLVAIKERARAAAEARFAAPDAQLRALTALSERGRSARVVAQAEALAKRFPLSYELYNILGVAYAKMDRLNEAVAAYNQALAVKPDCIEALWNLGDAFKRLEERDKSIACFEDAVARRPDGPQSHLHLANALAHFGRLDEAIAAYERALRIDPRSAEACYHLGNALKSLARTAEAIAAYEKAIEISPGFADAHNNLGTVYTDLGRREEAVKCYENAIAAKPDFARARHYLSSVKRFEADDPQIDQMTALLSRCDLSDLDRMHLHFGLGNAMDNVAEYAKAFEHFANGNRFRKSLTRYSIETDRALFQQIKNAHRAIAAQSDATARNGAGPTPVFIVGMPRSGTSLVEQILASHSKVHGAGEIAALERALKDAGGLSEDMPAAQLETIGCNYRKALAKRAPAAPFATDKLPLNFLWVGVIRPALPNAKIVWVERDARAACWSVYRRAFATKGNGYADDLIDIAEYYALYKDLMAFWSEAFPGDIYRVEYERLTEHQEEETRKLLNHIGLEWEDACLDFHKTARSVSTASSMQVRKKMYQGSSEAWRKYEPFLQPLIERLAQY